MKLLRNNQEPILILGVTLALVAIYAFARIPTTEGFNPSDDGVILAQSFRILNGEVPHHDFISIRPAGSGFMHLLHYLSPLPLELSARWLVLLEYLIYSILIAVILIGSWFKGLRKVPYYLLITGSILVMFVLNQNHYNLFPWTTIDGLFWFSLALYAWYRLKNLVTGKPLFWKTLLLFSVSFSTLCRQTFILPGILLVIRVIIWEAVTQKKTAGQILRSLLPAVLIGLLPAWLYMGMLTMTGSWSDFIQQMTGRTEFWQTAVVSFLRFFWRSSVWILFMIALVSGGIKAVLKAGGKDSPLIDMLIQLQKVVSFILKLVLMFMVFIKPEWLFRISFIFFWLLMLDLVLIYVHEMKLSRWMWPVFWVLLVSWTSAISLGDNAPVFATGWLAGTAILLQIKDFRNRIYRPVRMLELVIPALLVPALLVLSLVVQKRVNYRDLPASRLTCDGGDVFQGLKGISLSPEMYGYLTEIQKIYTVLGTPRDHFVVWPNNALIYPLLDSRNPFLLDWMQPAEYVGNEQKVIESIRQLLMHRNLVILVEKSNVKWLSSGKVPIDIPSADYPYLQLLDSLARPVDLKSAWFQVYATK